MPQCNPPWFLSPEKSRTFFSAVVSVGDDTLRRDILCTFLIIFLRGDGRTEDTGGGCLFLLILSCTCTYHVRVSCSQPQCRRTPPRRQLPFPVTVATAPPAVDQCRPKPHQLPRPLCHTRDCDGCCLLCVISPQSLARCKGSSAAASPFPSPGSSCALPPPPHPSLFPPGPIFPLDETKRGCRPGGGESDDQTEEHSR